MDESGAPGVKQFDGDLFLVALVLFKTKEAIDSANSSVIRLRQSLGLKNDYEFHCSEDGRLVKRRFVELISCIDCNYVCIGIRKDLKKKTASYPEMANRIIEAINDVICDDVNIIMDSNPSLRKELRKCAGHSYEIKLHERKSHTDDMLQVADYIANLSYRESINKKSTFFKKIADKGNIIIY